MEKGGFAGGVESGGGLRLEDAVRFFLAVKRAGGRSERTLEDYRKKLEFFRRWIVARRGAEDVACSEVGAAEIEAYIVYLKEERGLADSSRKNHLAVLRSFFRTVSKRMKLEDPFADLDEVRFHQKAPKRNYLTRREAEMLLAAVDKKASRKRGTSAGRSRRKDAKAALAARDHAAFSAMIYAGLRIEETTSLELGDLRFVRGSEELRVARGKGNKERIVPMNPKLKRSLGRYLKAREVLASAREEPSPRLFLNENGQRVTENTLRRRLYGWARRSNIKKREIKPHDLRRTFGTWFLQANPGHVRELAGLMGHSDLSQVMKYALSDERRAREGIGRL